MFTYFKTPHLILQKVPTDAPTVSVTRQSKEALQIPVFHQVHVFCKQSLTHTQKVAVVFAE